MSYLEWLEVDKQKWPPKIGRQKLANGPSRTQSSQRAFQTGGMSSLSDWLESSPLSLIG